MELGQVEMSLPQHGDDEDKEERASACQHRSGSLRSVWCDAESIFTAKLRGR